VISEAGRRAVRRPYRLKFHLAPPLIADSDPATGHLRKREYGPWMLTAFRVLARLKGLRGTPFDISPHRRAPRRTRRHRRVRSPARRDRRQSDRRQPCRRGRARGTAAGDPRLRPCEGRESAARRRQGREPHCPLPSRFRAARARRRVRNPPRAGYRARCRRDEACPISGRPYGVASPRSETSVRARAFLGAVAVLLATSGVGGLLGKSDPALDDNFAKPDPGWPTPTTS